MTNQELLNSLMNDPSVREMLGNFQKEENVNAVRGIDQNNIEQFSRNNNKNWNCCNCCWCCCDNRHHCDNRNKCDDDWGIWILLLLLFCGCGFWC